MENLKALKGLIAASLCLSLSAPPSTPAQAAPSKADSPAARAKARPAYHPSQLQGDQRILHALNRFTFGPRPGDLEAVRSEGLDIWFDRQLRPASLNNDDLNARLAEFPAMQWSTPDLLFRLPSDAMIRQASDGKVPIPPSGAEHAIYTNQIDRYHLRKQAKEEQKQLASAMTPAAAMTASSSAPSSASPAKEAQTGPAENMTAESTPEDPPFDPARATRILSLAPEQRLVQLASLKQPELDSFRKSLKPPQRKELLAGLNPEQREVVGALENPKNLVNNELCEERLTRDIYSNAQLQEVMIDFWLNHFNVFLHKNDETPYYLVSYERDVIRPLALGKFEDLLEATAHSPAMLLYLDNAGSIGPNSIAAQRAARNNNKNKAHEGLNENYARELMELHTLGVNGGYTQKDVTQVARVFTGWTVDRPQRGGGFRFDENRHDPGTKLVIGKKIKEHGEREGEEVLHMLASRPATAQFISRKLAIRFVSDNPPQSLVDRMASSYMTSKGEISAVLRTLFQSPEFWAADDYQVKVKTPLEYVVSSIRASNAQIDDLMPVVRALQGMGMPIYGSVPPTGYSWQSSAWVSAGALVDRMNFALSLAANKFGGLPNGWTAPSGMTVSSPNAKTNIAPASIPAPESEERRLESQLIAGGVSESTRTAVLDQLAKQGTDSSNSPATVQVASPVNPVQAAKAVQRQDELLAGLLLGSPEFQRR